MIPDGSILQPLEDAADAILNFFHGLGLNWGTSIIAMTITIRALLVPLTYRQIKGMRALQALQPQLKEIKEKFKNDPKRVQQETMRFYQENKINPLASCLPTLLQLPVFFALFRLLRGDSFEEDVIKTGEQSWLFISSVIEKPMGSETIILMVLFAASTALSTLATMRNSPTAGGGPQQYILFGSFALITVFFVPKVPAGLSLYWITTNFWTVGQTYVASKLIPAPEMPSPEQIAAAKPPPPSPRKKKRRR